jgi:hypothetical protein
MIVLLATPISAIAAPPRLGGPLVDGSVIRTQGCGAHFFIAFGNTFALAEWIGGDPVRDTEVLQTTDSVSSFEREGRMTVTNLATGRTVDLFIDKALMNNAEFTRLVAQTCH